MCRLLHPAKKMKGRAKMGMRKEEGEKEEKKEFKKLERTFVEFQDNLSRLSEIDREIVLGTIHRMEHSKVSLQMNVILFDEMRRIRKSKEISYNEFYRLLNEKGNGTVSKKTYESFLNRGSRGSALFADACEILGIEKSEIEKFDNNIVIQTQIVNSLQWKYESLSDSDRNAIYYLVSALYMKEHSPEVFEMSADMDSLPKFQY